MTDYGANAESSLDDPTVHEQNGNETTEITYEIIPQSSKRGHPKLIDNRGYTFGFQRQRGNVTDWQCVVRPKLNPCKAKVRQRGNNFEPGIQGHNHPAQPGAATTARIITSVKAKAVEDVFKPATAIVDEVLGNFILCFCFSILRKRLG